MNKRRYLLLVGLVIATLISSFILLTFFTKGSPEYLAASAAAKKEDWETAKRLLEPLVLSGDQDAIWLLGDMYARGWGVEKSREKANSLYSSLKGSTSAPGCPSSSMHAFAALTTSQRLGDSSPEDKAYWRNVAKSNGLDPDKCVASKTNP